MSNQRSWSRALSVASLLMWVMMVSDRSAFAESGARGVIEEIVVTAERREESLQDTPLAISAFTAEEIARSDLDSVKNIQFQVPGLLYAEVVSSAQVTLRGVGLELGTIHGEPGVAFNVDGVYLPRSHTAAVISSDLERVEVLRGPQGTLYGRNTPGGAVNLWTKVPNGELEGGLSILTGNADRVRARGAIAFPIIDNTLSARFSLVSDEHDGYRRNLTTGGDADGRDHQSFRGVLSWTPTDTVEVLFRYLHSRDDDEGPNFTYGTVVIPQLSPLTFFPGSGGTDPQNIRNDALSDTDRTTELYSNTVTWDLNALPLFGDAIFKSVTAYQESDWTLEGGFDGVDAFFLNAQDREQSETWTQEFTLSSSGNGSLEWVIGAFYFNDKADGVFSRPANATFLGFENARFAFEQDIEAWAAFGQATFHVTDRLRTTFGARFTSEKKDYVNNIAFDFPGITVPQCVDLSSDDKWTVWTPKIGVDYDVSDDILAYVSVSRGFKAGGANIGGCPDHFDQETLVAYELGFKSQWLNNRLQLNVAGFFYDYEDFQATLLVQNTSDIENATDAKVWGAEMELVTIPFEGFQIKAGVSYQKATFDDFIANDPLCIPLLNPSCTVVRDLEGNDLPRAPRLSYFVNLEYARRISDLGTATLRYEFAWSDRYFFTPFNNSFTEQPSFGLSNARLVLATAGGRFEESLGDFELHVYANNIRDEDYRGGSVETATTGGTMDQWLDPRNYGIELRYQF